MAITITIAGVFQFPTGSVLSADAAAEALAGSDARSGFNSPREVSCLPTLSS